MAEALIAPKVIEPRQDVQRHGVSSRSHQFTGSDDAFEVAHTGMWEFIGPSHQLAMRHSTKPPAGGVRTWDVEPVHPEGEWLAEFTEIRCVVGGNGTVDEGPPGRQELNATGHIVGMATKGAIVIRNGRESKLGPYANFRALHRYDDGRPFWTLSGVGLRPLPMGGAVPELDRGWMVGFRRQLVASGLVPAMHRNGLDFHVGILTNRIQEWGRKLDAGKLESATYNRLVEDTRKLIAAMTAAFERQFGDAGGPVLASHSDDAIDPLGVREEPPTTSTRRGRS